VSVQHLRPGSIWLLDIHDACYGQLLAASRVKRVDVKVSRSATSMTEVVSATLYPPGYTEADLG
jgi:hypothetical protein